MDMHASCKNGGESGVAALMTWPRLLQVYQLRVAKQCVKPGSEGRCWSVNCCVEDSLGVASHKTSHARPGRADSVIGPQRIGGNVSGPFWKEDAKKQAYFLRKAIPLDPVSPSLNRRLY